MEGLIKVFNYMMSLEALQELAIDVKSSTIHFFHIFTYFILGGFFSRRGITRNDEIYESKMLNQNFELHQQSFLLRCLFTTRSQLINMKTQR